MRKSISTSLHKLLSPFYRILGGQDEFWRVFRYLLTGAWNTLFGVAFYALLVSFPWGRSHYLLMTIPANIASISNAFLCYKLFVFKTKGGWLREYLRCYVVYGGGILIGFILIYLLVEALKMHPAIAQCVCVAFTTACSYLGHKLFSFRREETPCDGRTER